MNTAIEPQIIEPATAIVPMDLVQRALVSGASIDVIEKVMGLQERGQAFQARKAFDAAMAAAKAEIPVINKSRSVNFTTNRGRTSYWYEDFADIADAVAPILAKHGLSYRFRTDSSPDLIAVTCIIAHRDGHSEQTTLSGPRDDSGNKNSMQAIGSAVTYLQRYTLKAALGLAASVDDDAQSAGAPKVGKPTPQQYDEMVKREAQDYRDHHQTPPTDEAYNETWEALLYEATSTDAKALADRWSQEAKLRDRIDWSDPEARRALGEKVDRGLKALRQPGLATQRLEAQDQ